MIGKLQDKPQFLYKFRALDGASAHYTSEIIRKRSLWFSKPLSFNDPFDCVPVVSTAATDAEFKAYLDRLYKKHNPTMSREQRRASIGEIMKDPKRRHDSSFVKEIVRETVDRAVNSAGVLSLSSRFDHVLMWSHYASSHSGICLRFKLREESWLKNAQKVIYSPDRPIINIVKDEAMEMQRKAILVKADFWSYEEEWRVVDPVMGAGAHDFNPPDLDGIIFGKKTSQQHKDEFITLAANHPGKVELLQADIDAHKYRLICVPI